MALRVWLPLNGTLDNIGISDVTVTNNGATVDNNGKIGKCYSFDGTDDWIKITMPSGMTSLKNCSIALWGMGNNSFGGISHDGGATLATCTMFDGRWQLANGSWTYVNGGTRSTTTWHHFAITISEDTITTYYDGAQVTSMALASNIVTDITSSNFIEIGCDHPGGDEYGTIKVNDFRIYDHCLSPKEVKEISQGLVLHYKLNQLSQGSNQNLVVGLTAGGQTTVVGDTIVTSGQNSDTYFKIKLSSALELNKSYTMGIDAENLPDSSYFRFPIGSQSNSSAGYIDIYNGHNEVVFIANDVIVNCGTLLMMDDNARTAWSNQCIFKNFYIYENTSITDSSGYEHDGTTLGTPTISSDAERYGVSMLFDGVDDGIQIESADLPAVLNNACTIAFWMKSTGENGGRSIYFSSYNASPFWCIEKSSGNQFRYDWNGSPDQYNGTITDNIWTHICLCRDSTTSAKLYINGQLNNTFTTATTSLALGNIWRIARDVRTGDGTPYHGLMSDFRIYATALSAEDILDLYHTPANIDNLGGLHGFEFIDNINNRIMEANGTIATKNWNNSTLLKNYQQTNCQVTLTDDGLRIYRPPNCNPTDNGNTMWGGMRINNTRDGGHPVYGNGDNPIGLEKGHTYIIAFHVKGKSSNATNNFGWWNQMGWGGGGLGPTPTNVSYDFLPSNFNGEKECWYKWTINDDIVKTCTTSYSYAVAGNQYMSYADFAFGWQYQDTGPLGSDVYITNLRLYDITNLDISNIQKNGIIDFTQLDELTQTDKTSITFYKELQANNFIEK